MSNKIGDTLRKLRLEKNLNQIDLARMLNIKRQTYSSWERNVSSPDIATIAFLANFYKVSADYILGLTNVKITLNSENPKSDLETAINNLSDESRKELENYIKLLKIKDEVDKSKEEQSLTSEKYA